MRDDDFDDLKGDSGPDEITFVAVLLISASTFLLGFVLRAFS